MLLFTNNNQSFSATVSVDILGKYFYSLSHIVVVSTKCIDPWVLEFVVSNITGNNQWEYCISLDLIFVV
jgi:hypothetical protein